MRMSAEEIEGGALGAKYRVACDRLDWVTWSRYGCYLLGYSRAHSRKIIKEYRKRRNYVLLTGFNLRG